MSPREEVSLAAAHDAVRHLRPLLTDVWATLDAPDHVGGRWLEFYRGSPTSPAFVCVDAMNNVLHVRYRGPDFISIVYLPGWFHEVATAALTDRLFDLSAATVVDLASACPLSFDLTVVHPISGVTGRAKVAYKLLPFGYAFTPARGFGVTDAPTRNPAMDPSAVFHWSAMRLRIAAAPGVRFDQRPLVSDSTLRVVRAAYVASDASVSCDQSLSFEFERHRQPITVPPLGAPLRPTPLVEADVVASAVAMREASTRAVAIEQARPDGVDLLLMKPDLRPLFPRGQPPGWLPQWLVEAAKVADDAVFQTLKSMFDTYREWFGGLPETAPVPIRIRVDPLSAEDRFAYRLDRVEPDDGGPSFRLTVIRTAKVDVVVDKPAGRMGESDIRAIIEYREAVEDFDDVPLTVADAEAGAVTQPLMREATLQDVLQVAVTVGEFVPHPVIQAMYDLRDLGSVGSYVLTGKDLYGRPMSGLEAAITLGGVVIPEAIGRLGTTLLASSRRVTTIGDDPTPRLRAAADAVEADDTVLATVLAVRAEPR
jgi:hypothetical protein